MIRRSKGKSNRQIYRYSLCEINKMYELEDRYFETLFDSEAFTSTVLQLRAELNELGEIPELMAQTGHHCTIHRADSSYYDWDKRIDAFCRQFGLDEGYDLAFGPRYRIERHILFREPIGNLFHPLIRCVTDRTPVPHIAKIQVLPPEKWLSPDEMNWLLADIELLIVERQPAYPVSPTESRELFSDIENPDLSLYKNRLEDAVTKHIITDPHKDPFTLMALIEVLRDEKKLLYKEISDILGISEAAVSKRYIRAIRPANAAGIWFPPRPRGIRKKPESSL